MSIFYCNRVFDGLNIDTDLWAYGRVLFIFRCTILVASILVIYSILFLVLLHLLTSMWGDACRNLSNIWHTMCATCAEFTFSILFLSVFFWETWNMSEQKKYMKDVNGIVKQSFSGEKHPAVEKMSRWRSHMCRKHSHTCLVSRILSSMAKGAYKYCFAPETAMVHVKTTHCYMCGYLSSHLN